MLDWCGGKEEEKNKVNAKEVFKKHFYLQNLFGFEALDFFFIKSKTYSMISTS